MSKTHNYVYKITNKVNGKIYIGVHCTNNLDDGYMGSGTAIVAAIKKYGEENFTKEILVDYDSAEVAYRLEKMLVNEQFVKRRDTYNLSRGGLGGGHPAWNKGLSWSKEIRKKISESKKNPSEDTRRKISEAHKGKTPWNKGKAMSDEYREKASKAHKGKTSHRKGKSIIEEYGKERADEISQKLRESHKGQPSGMKGKHLSEAARKKMSEKRKGRTSPMKGKQQSDAAKEKNRQAHKGKTPWNKGKIMSDEFREKCRQGKLKYQANRRKEIA